MLGAMLYRRVLVGNIYKWSYYIQINLLQLFQKTKSGQAAASDDEAGDGTTEYVHAEHFRYLEDTFGDFGTSSKTNANLKLDDSVLSEGLDLDSEEPTTSSLEMAADDLELEIENQMKQDLLRAKQKRTGDEVDTDDLMILKDPPKSVG